jgi:hypothetical protein
VTHICVPQRRYDLPANTVTRCANCPDPRQQLLGLATGARKPQGMSAQSKHPSHDHPSWTPSTLHTTTTMPTCSARKLCACPRLHRFGNCIRASQLPKQVLHGAVVPLTVPTPCSTLLEPVPAHAALLPHVHTAAHRYPTSHEPAS